MGPLKVSAVIVLALFAAFAAAALAATSDQIDPEMAAWAQAFGSIAAIIAIGIPVYLQQRLARRESREVVMATVDATWNLMQRVANHHLVEPSPNEWWVPEWEIYRQALERCPIEATGSADALRAFIQFRELFERAEVFSLGGNAMDDPPLGFITYVMTSAADKVERISGCLKAK